MIIGHKLTSRIGKYTDNIGTVALPESSDTFFFEDLAKCLAYTGVCSGGGSCRWDCLDLEEEFDAVQGGSGGTCNGACCSTSDKHSVKKGFLVGEGEYEVTAVWMDSQ